MGRAVRSAAQVEGVVAQVVWRVCLSVIWVLAGTWQPFPPYLVSENLVFPEGARISMRKRCTGHMMAAVSGRGPCMYRYLPL